MRLWLLLSLLAIGSPARAEDGVVSGTVRQPDGSPAVRIRVAAMAASGLELDAVNGVALFAIAETDEAGRYRLEGIRSGRYYIVAGRVDRPTFYPGTPEINKSTIITVEPDTERSQIDFTVSSESTQPRSIPPRPPLSNNPFQQLPSAQAQKPDIPVKGRVVLDESSNGQKLPDSIVLSIRATRSVVGTANITISTGSTVQVSVDRDGTFTTMLPEDSTISVGSLPKGYSTKSATAGGTNLLQQPFNVRRGGPEIVIVLNADLRPRYRVEGRIVSPSPARSLFGEPIELVSESGSLVRIIVEAGNRFAFTNVLAGNYTLRFDSSSGRVQQRITVTDRDVNAELNLISP